MSPDAPQQSNPRPRAKLATAAFVVVANRLPVDRVENPGRIGGLAHLTGRPGHRVRAGDAEPPGRLGRLARCPG